jgi:hypothetical protein
MERRGERRKLAKGEVWFTLEDPGPLEFQGRLIDSSESGFRSIHSHAALATGQQVRFRHSHGSGYAVVVWNRIVSPEVESGFLILDK